MKHPHQPKHKPAHVASTTTKDVPFMYFLMTEQYTLGTPRIVPTSTQTIDVQFNVFAKNYALQNKLNLGSTIFIRPLVHPRLTYPVYEPELIHDVACFLSAFCEDPVERKERKDYLLNNGVVRIYVKDEQLRKDLESILPQKPVIYFRVTDKYTIGTPEAVPASSRTIELPFFEFANDYYLQVKLKLKSAELINPTSILTIGHFKGQDLIEEVARYMAEFTNNPAEKEARKTYLLNNGVVRILINDNRLRHDINEKHKPIAHHVHKKLDGLLTGNYSDKSMSESVGGQ